MKTWMTNAPISWLCRVATDTADLDDVDLSTDDRAFAVLGWNAHHAAIKAALTLIDVDAHAADDDVFVLVHPVPIGKVDAHHDRTRRFVVSIWDGLGIEEFEDFGDAEDAESAEGDAR